MLALSTTRHRRANVLDNSLHTKKNVLVYRKNIGLTINRIQADNQNFCKAQWDKFTNYIEDQSFESAKNGFSFRLGLDVNF